MMFERCGFYCERRREIAEKYFSLWKIFVQGRKKNKNISFKHNDLEEKLSDFLKNINFNGPSKKYNGKAITPSKINKACKGSEIFENRYLKQKEIIENQKTLISEQTRLINELKNNQEFKCSRNSVSLDIEMTKTKVPLPCNKTIIKPEDHPLVRKMKEREEERRLNREFFEMKKKEKEKYIAEKLAQEEEKRKKLEIERRRQKLREKKELERLKKEEELRKVQEKDFCLRLDSTVRKTMERLMRLKVIRMWRHDTQNMAELQKNLIEYFKKAMLLTTIRSWRARTVLIRTNLESKANILVQRSLVNSCWLLWAMKAKESLAIKGAAMKWYNEEIKKRVFRKWSFCSKISVASRQKIILIMNAHYERMLLCKSLDMWKKLPMVLYREREREKRLRQWESKVKSVLPDYNLESST